MSAKPIPISAHMRQSAERITQLEDEIALLRHQIAERDATIAALRKGSGNGVLVAGPFTLDLFTRQATLWDRALKLRPKEFVLLEMLARYPGQTVDSAALMDRLACGRDALSAHVWQLRNEIGDGFIIADRGAGYTLKVG